MLKCSKIALLLVVAGCFTACKPLDRLVQKLVGPPEVQMREAHADDEGTASFDHSAFDEVLKAHVDERGRVDYAALADAPDGLDGYIARLAEAPFDELGRDEKLALLINAYNAFTLRLILDHYPVESIKEISADERWGAQRWMIGGKTFSLEEIEHQEIRPKFVEPRIHFALVCAAVGCPPLRREAYTGARLEEQLQAQTVLVHSDARWFQFDPAEKRVALTRLYSWYGSDFEQGDGGVLDYVARYSPEVARAREQGVELSIEWLPYDWTLNGGEDAESAEETQKTQKEQEK